MKNNLLLFILLLLAGSNSLFARVLTSPKQPLSSPPLVQLHFVESKSYCHGGYGSQETIYQFNGKYFAENTGLKIYLPPIKPLKLVYLEFGCVVKNIYFGYSKFSEYLKLNKPASIKSKAYTHLQIDMDSLNLGYSISIIPNRLYFDTGASYLFSSYKLGLFETAFSNNQTTDMFHENNILAMFAGKLFLSNALFLKWLHQINLDKNKLVLYTNQFGINLFARF